jgi:hypothetical protein
LMVDALIRLDDRGALPRRGQGARRDEVRPGLACVVQREATPDGPEGLAFRHDRLRADRVAVTLPPHRLMEAVAAAKCRHLRPAGDLVFPVPAECCLQLSLRGHRRIVGRVNLRGVGSTSRL